MRTRKVWIPAQWEVVYDAWSGRGQRIKLSDGYWAVEDAKACQPIDGCRGDYHVDRSRDAKV